MLRHMAQEPWGKEFTDRVGAEVARRRAALDLSAQQVADRTAELGHAVSRSVVSDLGNPRRPSRLTVPDWLVLAAALEVPPLALLFPGLPANTVEPLPDWTVPAQRAFDWAFGDAEGPHALGNAWSSILPSPIRWARLAQELDLIDAEIEGLLKRGGNPERLRAAREEMRDKERKLAAHEEWATRISEERGYGWKFSDPAEFVRGYDSDYRKPADG